ncbi:hypothetical protein BDN70DRAFT_815433 [Pholiota conissans]|uniref:DUF202 domain-containing protein n=1 Tax=Pholiota conissans TaxID=109636 RepID=A0A9P6CQ21_9AGAR|nr:hypothetical protein BDN70DRAFT_815433 [Pholiota conissans]
MFFKWEPSLILINHGSVARDHLALERTFLAYMRTSLALASTGIALVQLFAITESNTRNSQASRGLPQYGRPLGIASIVLALIILALGFYRFFSVQFSLLQKKFPTARMSVAFVALMLAAIIMTIFVALFGSVTSS